MVIELQSTIIGDSIKSWWLYMTLWLYMLRLLYIYVCLYIYIYIYTHVYSTPCNLGIISIREGWESRNVKTKASTHYDDILFAEARSRAGLPAEFVIENHHYGINYWWWMMIFYHMMVLLMTYQMMKPLVIDDSFLYWWWIYDGIRYSSVIN